MRGERRGEKVDIVEKKTREFLVVGVTLGLARPDRHRPGALLGKDGLVVPIGAFHEPHGQRALGVARPGDEFAQILLAVAQIDLEGDAHLRLPAEFLLLED